MAKKFAAIEGLHNFLVFDDENNRYLLNEISPEGIGIDHNTICFVSADNTDVGRCIGSSDAPITINDRYIIVQNDIFALYGDKDISPTPDQTWRPIYVKGEEVLSDAASGNLDFRDSTYIKTSYTRNLSTNSLALTYNIDLQALANAIVSLIILPTVETPNDGELQVEISDSTVHTDKDSSHDVEIPQNTLSVKSTYIEDQEQPDPEDPENTITEPVEVEGNFTANTDKDTTVSIYYKGTADRVDWWVDGETRDEKDSNNSDAKKFVYIECMQEFFTPISDAPFIALNDYGKTVISEDSIVFITCGKKLTNTSSGTITTSDAEIFDNPEYYDGARFIWTHNKMFSANTWLPIFTRETVRDTLMGLTPPIGTSPHGARLIIQGANGVTVSNSQNESDGYHERIITISGPIEGGGGAGVETGHIYDAGYDSLAEGVNPQYAINTASGIRSHAEGIGTTASGAQSHAEGYTTTASGNRAHTEGSNTQATKNNSHAEGNTTISSGEASHAEGINTSASNDYSHAEGNETIASGRQSHAEGHNTIATASSAHAEGFETKAINNGAHAEGYKAEASGYYSHAEGALIHDTSIYSEDVYAKASGDYSHSEGYGNISAGKAAHAEGLGNIAYGYASHAEGIANEGINPEFEDLGVYGIRCFGDSYIRAFNKLYLENTLKLQGDIVKDNYEFYLDGSDSSYNEGIYIIYADSEAYNNGDQPLAYIAPSDRIYLENSITIYDEDEIEYVFDSGTYFKLNALSSKLRSYIDSGSSENFYIIYRDFGALNTGTHIEGSDTCASGLYAHAENNLTKATELAAHAEGYESEASGRYSHAEGYNAKAKGKAAHAEGYYTEASGDYSHAEGYYTEASGDYSHAEGYNQARIRTLEKTISTLDNTTKRAFNELFLAKKSSIASIYRSNDFDLFMDLSNVETTYINDNYVIFAYESENAYLLGADPIIIFRDKDYYYLNRNTTVYYGDKTLYDENENPIGTEPVYVTIPKGLYLRAYDPNSFIGGDQVEKDFYLVLKKYGSFGVASHTEGFYTEASNDYSHAEGYHTEASGEYGAHAEGKSTRALGEASHAEGHMTESSGSYAHAEGYMTEASGEYGAHAEGKSTRALGAGSHAEGGWTETSGSYSHAEGYQTEASGSYAHAEGYDALALGVSSHAEGTYTYAYGESAHAEGLGGILRQSSVSATVVGSDGEIKIPTASLPADMLAALFNTLNGGIINYAQTSERYIIQGGVLSNSIHAGYYTLSSYEDEHVYLYRLPKDPESTAKSIQDVFGDSSNEITITINFVYGQNAMGIASHSEGHQTAALGDYSHSEGDHTIADGYAAHAEGMDTKAKSSGSHAEGVSTKAESIGSHAEGDSTTAGYRAHAEGYNTTALLEGSHAEGSNTTASGNYSHAEGYNTKAVGNCSHAEGNGLASTEIIQFECSRIGTAEKEAIKAKSGITFTYCDHNNRINSNYGSQGSIYSDAGCTILIDDHIICRSYSDGTYSGVYFNLLSPGKSLTDQTTYYWKRVCKAGGSYSHAEGSHTTASGDYSHAEGAGTTALGAVSHAEGWNTVSAGSYSHAEGAGTTAFGPESHAEGADTTASGNYSHAEGYNTTASGEASHAEGTMTTASGYDSHSEGSSTTASGNNSHAEGVGTTADGAASHTEGGNTTAFGNYSHAEGFYTQARGNCSHASGERTIIRSDSGFVCGRYNDSDEDTQQGALTHFQIGGGNSDSQRSNILSIWTNAGQTGQYTMNFPNGTIICSSVQQPSDERKKNITGEIDLDKAYELIDKCQTILYTLKDTPQDKEHIGLIAQEVHEIFPELVNIDNKGYMSLDYSRLTVIIFKVLKDVIRRLNDLEKNK